MLGSRAQAWALHPNSRSSEDQAGARLCRDLGLSLQYEAFTQQIPIELLLDAK